MLPNFTQVLLHPAPHSPGTVVKSVKAGPVVGHGGADQSQQVVVVARGGLRRRQIGNRSLELGNAAIEKLEAVVEGAALRRIQATVEAGLELRAIGVGGVDLDGGEIKGASGNLLRREGGQFGERTEGLETEVWVQSVMAD